jgi:hypothetical protein
MMRQQELGHGDPIGPLDWRKILAGDPCASSHRLGWVGLEAAHFRAAPDSELNQPASTHHTLVLVTRPPEELDLRFEKVKRHVPPPAGAIMLVPAGSPSVWRWRNSSGHRLGSATAPACWSAPVGVSSCAPASPVLA